MNKSYRNMVLTVEQAIKKSRQREEAFARASAGIRQEKIAERRENQQERLRAVEKFLDKPLFGKVKKVKGRAVRIRIKPGIQQFF